MESLDEFPTASASPGQSRRSRLIVRIVQSCAVLGLAIAALALLVIAAFAGFLSRGLPEETPVAGGWLYVPLAIAALIVIAAIAAVVRGISWAKLSITAVPVAVLAAFLGYDPRPPTKPPDLGPRISRDDPGYMLFQQVVTKSEHSRLETLMPTNAQPVSQSIRLPEQESEWRAYVSENSIAIDQAWEEQGPARAWLEAILQTPPGGLWPKQGVNDPVLSYQFVRRLSMVTQARAVQRAQLSPKDDAGEMFLVPLDALGVALGAEKMFRHAFLFLQLRFRRIGRNDVEVPFRLFERLEVKLGDDVRIHQVGDLLAAASCGKATP